jgi:glycosyltransferase involved in cell wall biosynthesis
MNPPQISILTPVLNAARFIEACIRNVAGQNCPSAEHIIIDGHSTDGTVDIIQQGAQRYPHIRWAFQNGRGISDAINQATEMAASDIIGILNADDFYEPGVLNRVLKIFQTLPEPSLVVGNCNVLNADDKLAYVNKPSRLALKELLLMKNIAPHPENPSAYFYHKALHEKIGGYAPLAIAMDLDFILRAVQAAHSVYVDEVWGNFRFRKGSITYEDFKSGLGEERYKKIMADHRKDLPLLERPMFYLKFAWHYGFRKPAARIVRRLVRRHGA